MAFPGPGSLCRALAFLVSLVCFSAPPCGSTAFSRETGTKHVLVLHSFGREFKPWSEYAKAIRLELERQSPWPLDIQEHALITARSADDNPEAAFVEYLNALFVNQRPDLIVSVGAPAAAFVQRHRERLFPTIPMILAVVDKRRVKYSVLGPYDVVAAVDIDYGAAIRNILQVLPDTKQIAVVVGTSPIEKFWKNEIGHVTRELEDRVKFTFYDAYSFEDLLKHAASLPPNSAIFWELMIVDAAGVTHEEGKALTQLHAVANAPIFTYTDAFFGREIVGGPHVPVAGAAQQVAAAAMRLLSGANPQDVVVPPAGMDRPKFDWRQLQRWGISEARLPSGSEVLFRSPSVWEQYRPLILGASAAFVGQALFILWLLNERRRRRVAEVLARSTMAELHSVNRLAAAGELSASIAHEVKQPLQAAAANAYAARNWLAAGRLNIDEARGSLNRILDSVNRANDVVSGIRAMFEREKEETERIDVNDIVRSVISLVSPHIRKHDIDAELLLDNRVPSIEGHAVPLKQVVLNLVMNAIESMQSAPVRKLTVSTQRAGNDGVLVRIQDTGSGIAPENLNRIFKPLFTTKSAGMGMGLSICRSIVEAHGGRITASSPAEGGSIFEFELHGASAGAG